ncbi:hypothetical protein N1851_028416 [Merluccius polli]|uniref:Uncharacterized protein n=1 Tax=Merluccius polli TaxID=89951 RepID=A0AA47M915_MERPO|nr:hypothetical protein N1851_028416 [Merluccius polli]
MAEAKANFPTIPVPELMDMIGDVYNNCTFFRAQWENYEIATGLNEKTDKIHLATLLTVMGPARHTR